jgi:hypothetical protein
MAGRAETRARRRPARSKNNMDRINETVYPAGLPGVSRMILWLKFSTDGGDYLR